MNTHLIFTRTGLHKHQRRLEEAHRRVNAAGKEVGEEAGLACDWHDNFGYEEARRRLEEASELARRISEDLSRARVVEPVMQDEIVAIGTTVVLDVDGAVLTYRIAGYGETDLPKGVVSYDAPLIQKVLGAHVEDERVFRLAGKDCVVTVLEIKPPDIDRQQLHGAHHG